MADVSSSSSAAHTRATTYVHKACSNCRHRKIRCDGERPICRRCRLQPPRSRTRCKYSHPPREVFFSLAQEGESGDTDQVLLRPPYSDYVSLPSNIVLEYSEGPTDTSTPGSIEVASRDMNATWLDVFLNRFAQHQFFFLDPAELKSAILNPVPAAHSHHDIPSSGLSNAVFLWACRISQNFIVDSGYSEEGLLGQTVSAIAGDAMSIDSWHQTLQVVQAEVLLSLYYMETGRLLEGSRHCAAATSLAFSTGLHQLGYPSYTGPLPQEFLRVSLPTVPDNARSAESVNAFVSVVILNNYWVAVSGVPSSVPSGTTINATWPAMVSSAHHSTGNSMFNILSQYYHVTNLHSTAGSTSNYASGNSPLALLEDASNLLQHAIAFTALYQGTYLYPGTDLHRPAEFWALDHRLETFRDSLLLITCGCGPTGTGLITHIFVHAAILQLHSPHTITSIVSHAKCLSAGSGVAACLADTRLGDWEHADPVLGPLLAAFAEFLIAQLPLSMGPSVELVAILSALHTLAPRSALIEKCHTVTQHRYAMAQMGMQLEALPQQ